MRKRSIQINIPEPCHQQWDEMKPESGGMHCDSCNKCVKDFTRMSDEEVYRIIKNSKGTICGRFSNSQLSRPVTSYEQSSFDLLKVAAIAAGFALLSSQSDAKQLNKSAKAETITSSKTEPLLQLNALKNNEVPADTTCIIKGIVTDAETGRPIPYAVIALFKNDVVVGSAVSDADGQYTMSISSSYKGNCVIKTLYVGYLKKVEPIVINSPGEIVLNMQLDVIVNSCPTMGIIVSNPLIDMNNFSDSKTYKFPR